MIGVALNVLLASIMLIAYASTEEPFYLAVCGFSLVCRTTAFRAVGDP